MSEASDAADDMEPHIAAAGADADERSPRRVGTSDDPPYPSKLEVPSRKIPSSGS
jgi:hypothetical protein